MDSAVPRDGGASGGLGAATTADGGLKRSRGMSAASESTSASESSSAEQCAARVESSRRPRLWPAPSNSSTLAAMPRAARRARTTARTSASRSGANTERPRRSSTSRFSAASSRHVAAAGARE
jgi:hypothetical protein